MNKICTSIEQSQKLIGLGIDVNTADMCWCTRKLHCSFRKLQWGEIKETMIAYPMLPNQEKSVVFKYIPAWSLSKLMELMSKSIISTPNPLSANYCCRNIEFDIECYADNPVDAAYEMIVWLKENEKI